MILRTISHSIAACLGLFLAVVATQASAVDLLAHQAAYRMSLSEAKRASGILGARGSMTYTFGRRCDGWTVENRTELRMVYEGGRIAETAWSFASWESDDGRSFRFRARFSEGGRTIEQIVGHAELDGPSLGGTAWLSEPEEKTIELPKGTVFPTQHMISMIRSAEQGESSLARYVFDGASVDNPYLVNAFFGPLGIPETNALASAMHLSPQPSWWSRLAFFPMTSESAVPDFELGARYRMDGVADQITQHFEDFSLDVRLDHLEPLPDPDC